MSQASQRSQSDLASAIGSRVTIRLREASNGFRDIVGVLQRYGAGVGELINSKGEATRVGYRMEDGKKVRYAKKSNEVI